MGRGTYVENGSNKWFRPNFRSENNNFGGHFSWSPDFGRLWDSKTWNFVIFDIIPRKYWLKRAKWAMSSYGGVKNVWFDIIVLFFLADGHPKTQNVFFVFPTITQHSDGVDPIWVAPWESWRPDNSKNVWVVWVLSFWMGVIAAQSQQSLKFSTRHRK